MMPKDSYFWLYDDNTITNPFQYDIFVNVVIDTYTLTIEMKRYIFKECSQIESSFESPDIFWVIHLRLSANNFIIIIAVQLYGGMMASWRVKDSWEETFLRKNLSRGRFIQRAMVCLNLLCAEYISGNINIYLHFLIFRAVRECRQFKSLFVTDKDPLILHIQCHVFWRSCDVRGQVYTSHDIGLVFPEPYQKTSILFQPESHITGSVTVIMVSRVNIES